MEGSRDFGGHLTISSFVAYLVSISLGTLLDILYDIRDCSLQVEGYGRKDRTSP
jgi:hypothetical protein